MQVKLNIFKANSSWTHRGVKYLITCPYNYIYLLSTASFRSIPFLSFMEPIFAWNVPLVSLIFLKRSLIFPILLFSVVTQKQRIKVSFVLSSFNSLTDPGSRMQIYIRQIFKKEHIRAKICSRRKDEPSWTICYER